MITGSLRLFPMYSNKNDGFTLIEIVLAILIFSILSTTLFYSYRSLFSAKEKIDAKIELLLQSRSVLLRLTEDLRNFYCELRPLFKEPKEFGEKSKYFFITDIETGEYENSSILDFTSYSHLGFGGDLVSSPSEILYFLKDNILYRGDFIYPYPETDREKKEKSYALCRNVSSFKIVLFDENGDEYEGWNSDEKEFNFSTPFSVKIIMEITAGGSKEKYETTIELPVHREKIE